MNRWFWSGLPGTRSDLQNWNQNQDFWFLVFLGGRTNWTWNPAPFLVGGKPGPEPL